MSMNIEYRRGAQVHKAKLTDAKVRTIRRYSAKGKDHAWIAKKYDITTWYVGQIVRRAVWRHVE